MNIPLNLRRPMALGLAAVMAASLIACKQDPPDSTTASTAAAETTQVTAPATTTPQPAETTEATQPAETTVATEATQPVSPTENQDQTADSALEALRLRMEPSGAVAGIFFLGYTDLTIHDDGFFDSLDRQDLLDQYPFIRDIPLMRMAHNGGGQVFCIVPFDPQAESDIRAVDMNTEETTDTIIELHDGAPYLIQANSSDLIPSVSVSIRDNFANNMVDYRPHISLQDGTVSTPDDALILDFTGFYGNDDPIDPTEPIVYDEGLDEIRLKMEPSAAIAGIIYLGSSDYSLGDVEFFHSLDNQTALLKYAFIGGTSMDRYIRNEGRDVFCIIPADPDAHVEVNYWNGGEGILGDLIYASDSGDPLILQGNVSDIVPNLSITITDSYGNTLEHYQPFISLGDGTVSVPDDGPLLLDLTGY